MYVAGIDVFLAIIQTRSLNKAAELMHLTQATISYRLKKLEEELAGTLFERSKGIHTVTLTPYGENFVNIAERWSALKQDSEILQTSGPQLKLSVGGSNSLNTYVLPPLYQALSQHSPKIRLQFRTQHSGELYDTLERHEIDVAFVKMKRPSPNIIVELFYVDEMVLIRCATPENRELELVRPSDLKVEHEVYMNWSPSYQTWHDLWWDPFHYARIPVDTAGLIFSLMQNWKQWAILPKSVANSFVKTGRFVIQPLSDPPPARNCYKATPKYPTTTASKGLKVLNKYLENILLSYT
jgi:DNA-binding transcriptional LysR family regulator